jgi:hypothetical protein
MGNAWLAEVGVDPHERAREIADAHTAFVTTHTLAGLGRELREVVARSWVRSSDARIGFEDNPPIALADDDLYSYRAAHPLAKVIDVLRGLVGSAADDGNHVMAVSDAAGRLLWVEGHRTARTRAEKMNFVAGAWWDEAHAGTNAPGTAIAVDHAIQIFASEHFLPAVQAWTCSAAPIHDPATGRILGVIDITGGDGVANALSLGLVSAAALAAEAELAQQLGPGAHVVRPARLWLPRPRAGARLSALGRGEGTCMIDGREHRLNRRHSEIMVMLALHPDGLTGDHLADALYGAPVNPTTLRVEMTRLRHIVGELLVSRPYRLDGRLAADFLDVAAALRANDVADALAEYAGPLLPSSDAPGVVREREWLELRLRSAVLACPDPAPVRDWADRGGLDDLQIWEHLLAVAPPCSQDATLAAARVRRLRDDYGLEPDATSMQRPRT